MYLLSAMTLPKATIWSRTHRDSVGETWLPEDQHSWQLVRVQTHGTSSERRGFLVSVAKLLCNRLDNIYVCSKVLILACGCCTRAASLGRCANLAPSHQMLASSYMCILVYCVSLASRILSTVVAAQDWRRPFSSVSMR